MSSLNARDQFNCSPLLFSWPAPRNRCGQTERGGWDCFYRASACNACRARYCFTSSVCPSVCLSAAQCRHCVKTDGHIVTLFWISGRGIIHLQPKPSLQNSCVLSLCGEYNHRHRSLVTGGHIRSGAGASIDVPHILSACDVHLRIWRCYIVL